MSNPFKMMQKREWILWMVSTIVVVISNIVTGTVDPLTLIASVLGVTSLVFAAIGNVWAQALMIVFCLMYGVISWRNRYYSEMITYLGMALPMAIWSLVTWAKHSVGNEVEVARLTRTKIVILVVSSIVVTIGFFFILKALDTPSLYVSTLSVTTSFLAATLTMLRSPYYALFYAMNDVVLVVLWVLASIHNPIYIGVVANFAIFLINDLYGFVSWRKRAQRQTA